jgi:hypothetical protein
MMIKWTQPDAHRAATEVPRNPGHPRQAFGRVCAADLRRRRRRRRCNGPSSHRGGPDAGRDRRASVVVDRALRRGEHRPDQRLEVLERFGRVIGVERVLVVLRAEPGAVVEPRVIPELIAHVTVPTEVMEEVVPLEDPVLLDHPVVLFGHERLEDRCGDVESPGMRGVATEGSRENPVSAAQRNPTPTPTKAPDEPSVLTRTVAGRPPQVAALPRCGRIGR